MKKVQITETVLRDANQSLMATRLPYSDYEPILATMDKAGYYSVECWGGATFDSCLRYLGEDPWERLRGIRKNMKVKYQLAVAMSHRARLLIFDEPTSGLDPVSRDDLLDLFLTLQEEEGASILFSSHITSDLEKCAKQIAYIRNGRLLASCPMADFLARWQLVKGAPEALTPALRETLIGVQSHQAGFEALVPAGAGAPGCQLLAPTLENIMYIVVRTIPLVTGSYPTAEADAGDTLGVSDMAEKSALSPSKASVTPSAFRLSESSAE